MGASVGSSASTEASDASTPPSYVASLSCGTGATSSTVGPQADTAAAKRNTEGRTVSLSRVIVQPSTERLRHSLMGPSNEPPTLSTLQRLFQRDSVTVCDADKLARDSRALVLSTRGNPAGMLSAR